MLDIICKLNIFINRPAIGVELYLKGFNIEGILIGNGWVDPIK